MGKNFAKLFAESGLATIKKAIQAANTMVQSFSLEDMGKACDEAQTRLTNEVKRFKNQFFNFIDKYTVEIPYNKNNEYLTYEITPNAFNVSVNSNDGDHVSNHVFTLPSDVDSSEMTQTYDSERKVMIFKFGKHDD